MRRPKRKRLQRFFERGFTSRHRDGHGVGLAIVTRLLEHMGAELRIDTAPGGGGRFCFELLAPLAAECDLEPILEDGDMADMDGDGRVVLVVDDDRQQCELTCDLLDSCGFNSVAATDGRMAREALQDQAVDLVMTDQCMPGMSGWDLLRTVREARPGLPVLLYSALPPQRPAGMDRDIGFDATMLKPADGGRLVRRMMQLLETSGIQNRVELVGTRQDH